MRILNSVRLRFKLISNFYLMHKAQSDGTSKPGDSQVSIQKVSLLDREAVYIYDGYAIWKRYVLN